MNKIPELAHRRGGTDAENFGVLTEGNEGNEEFFESGDRSGRPACGMFVGFVVFGFRCIPEAGFRGLPDSRRPTPDVQNGRH